MGANVLVVIAHPDIDRYLRTNEKVKNLVATIKFGNTVLENIFTHSGYSNRRDADVPGFFNLVLLEKIH